MRVGIATDHGGFTLKEQLTTKLNAAGRSGISAALAKLLLLKHSE
jgi:hypothetical protein